MDKNFNANVIRESEQRDLIISAKKQMYNLLSRVNAQKERQDILTLMNEVDEAFKPLIESNKQYRTK